MGNHRAAFHAADGYVFQSIFVDIYDANLSTNTAVVRDFER